MKILIPSYSWKGGTESFVGAAFEKLGHQVVFCPRRTEREISPVTHYLKLRQIKKFQPSLVRRVEERNNRILLDTARREKPDLLFSLNSPTIFPETVRSIREQLKITTASWVADNPFDSSRFKYFPLALEYFEFLFLGDRIWEQNVRNMAPESAVHHLVGAYCPDSFKPVDLEPVDRERYGCDLAFAGSAYGMKAEGVYRAGILARLTDFDLRVWGDNAWELKFRFYPQLRKAYQGGRLDFPGLNKLYQAARINLNIPNPQCLTSFQQRTFEIAAAGGFQLVDYRSDLDEYFGPGDMVSFKDIGDLREKVTYFLDNPRERSAYARRARRRVEGHHTYETRMKQALDIISER